jgi:hypothetical protein
MSIQHPTPMVTIAIAGGRNAGKSWALKICTAALRAAGWYVVELDDHGTGPAGLSAHMAEARAAAGAKPLAVVTTGLLPP